MGSRVLRIGLDSTVFRNRVFLEWLREAALFSIHISILVYVETLLWYKLLGLSRQDFDRELGKLPASIRALTEALADQATGFALQHRREHPFHHHARDYIIGATARSEQAALITYNTEDFTWLRRADTPVLTPEEFVAQQLRG